MCGCQPSWQPDITQPELPSPWPSRAAQPLARPGPAGDEGWWEKHGIWVGETNPPGVDASYSELLASSVFCFSLMGDGFSARFDDAVIHGCAPGSPCLGRQELRASGGGGGQAARRWPGLTCACVAPAELPVPFPAPVPAPAAASLSWCTMAWSPPGRPSWTPARTAYACCRRAPIHQALLGAP